MGGIGIEFFQQTGIGIGIDILGRAELINSIFNSTNSYFLSCSVASFTYTRLNVHSCFLTMCVNLTFQYINHSYRVPLKYTRYLLAIKIIHADTTEVTTHLLTTRMPAFLQHCWVTRLLCVWNRDQALIQQSSGNG